MLGDLKTKEKSSNRRALSISFQQSEKYATFELEFLKAC